MPFRKPRTPTSLLSSFSSNQVKSDPEPYRSQQLPRARLCYLPCISQDPRGKSGGPRHGGWGWAANSRKLKPLEEGSCWLWNQDTSGHIEAWSTVPMVWETQASSHFLANAIDCLPPPPYPPPPQKQNPLKQRRLLENKKQLCALLLLGNLSPWGKGAQRPCSSLAFGTGVGELLPAHLC